MPFVRQKPLPKPRVTRVVLLQSRNEITLDDYRAMTPRKKNIGSEKWKKVSFRVPNGDERAKIEYLYQKSGMKHPTAFIRARLLDQNFKTATVNVSLQKFCDQLTSLIYQVNKIGVNYNQTVHAINTHHGLKVSMALLKNLSSRTEQLQLLLERVIALEDELRDLVVSETNTSDQS